jgi:hypothetical protein
MRKNKARSRRTMSAAEFNEKFQIGQRFRYYAVLGIPDSVEVVTRSGAWELGHGEAVVLLEGRTGGFSVEHLTPIESA